ncbi:MAG: hypothetical protein E4G94_05745 [ANME-2 cluster archaeon]|nr:MAG: hypothetical protein E4G94_05745 [ANME-2 cluster archaeon]
MTPVKILTVFLLILALTLSGCTTEDEPAADQPVKEVEPETQIYTTPDGLKFFGPYGHDEADGQYVPVYDTDGDIDARDSAVGPNDAAIDGNIANAIRYNFGIPQNSKLHQDYPNIEEFRIRKWDFDGDRKFLDKVEILINDKIVHSSTTDIDGKNGVNIVDTFSELGWI